MLLECGGVAPEVPEEKWPDGIVSQAVNEGTQTSGNNKEAQKVQGLQRHIQGSSSPGNQSLKQYKEKK